MKRRRLLAAVVVAASCGVLAVLAAIMGRDERPTWPKQAQGACTQGVFGLPDNLLPPELRSLLGDRSAQKATELSTEVFTTLNELIVNSFPDTPLNLNCERGAYDPMSLRAIPTDSSSGRTSKY